MNVYLIVPQKLVPGTVSKRNLKNEVIFKCASNDIPESLTGYRQHTLDEILQEIRKPEWNKPTAFNGFMLWLARAILD